jgi:hypothetical protein
MASNGNLLVNDLTIVGAVTGGAITVRPCLHAPAFPRGLSARTPPWANDPAGVFVAFFWPFRSVRVYDPFRERRDMWKEAASLDVDDPRELTTFVSRWGLLGAAHPYVDDEGTLAVDSVTATERELREFQVLSGWLLALKNGRWRSPALPVLPRDVPPRHRPRWLWWEFRQRLNRALDQVTVRPQLGGPGDDWLPGMSELPQTADSRQGALAVLTPRDALFFGLWVEAKDMETRMAECCCGRLFRVRATNRRQRYCSGSCQRGAAWARWYKHPANRRAVNAARRARYTPRGVRRLRPQDAR